MKRATAKNWKQRLTQTQIQLLRRNGITTFNALKSCRKKYMGNLERNDALEDIFDALKMPVVSE